MKSRLKALGLRALIAAAGPLLPRVLPPRICIVMLHRFAVPDLGIRGHSADGLRRGLAELRRLGVTVRSLEDVVTLANSQRVDELSGAPIVVFTVDDGYWDMLEIGDPIFREFDCPYTGFVVPESIATGRPFWWDQVSRMFRLSETRHISLAPGSGSGRFEWHNEETRSAASTRCCEILKAIPNAERLARLDELSALTGVPLLEHAPEVDRVSDWAALRLAEGSGLAQFGAHTMTHPILSRCDDDQSAWEIEQSTHAVRQELSRPSNVFCYPNGTSGDFGEREIATLTRLGYTAAVATVPVTVTSSRYASEWSALRWRLPRVALEDDPLRLVRAALAP